jgi:hypothetical protein
MEFIAAAPIARMESDGPPGASSTSQALVTALREDGADYLLGHALSQHFARIRSIRGVRAMQQRARHGHAATAYGLACPSDVEDLPL